MGFNSAFKGLKVVQRMKEGVKEHGNRTGRYCSISLCTQFQVRFLDLEAYYFKGVPRFLVQFQTILRCVIPVVFLNYKVG